MTTLVTLIAAVQLWVSVWSVLRGHRHARPHLVHARLLPTPATVRAAPPNGDDWAEWLHHAAGSVRSGHSLATAVQQATSHTGISPTGEHHHEGADRAVVVTALQMATVMGGPVAATLQQAASVLRERSALRAEAAVHAAQSRLSARVLTVLPVGVAGLGTSSSASFRAALASPAGVACACAGGVLNLIGWRWMRREINRVCE